MVSETPDLGIDAAKLGQEKARRGGERKRLDRRKGSMPAGEKGQEMGKVIVRYEDHVALECLLGSIVFQHLILNQDNLTKPVVLAMPHSPNQLPWLGDTGGKEYFPWQAREHPIRQVKNLNIMTASVLLVAS